MRFFNRVMPAAWILATSAGCNPPGNDQATGDSSSSSPGNGGRPAATLANGGVVTASWERGGEEGERILRQKDGKYVVVAMPSSPSSIGKILLGRFTASGRPDETFGRGGFSQPNLGRGAIASWPAFALQPDGRILVAAEIASSNTAIGVFARFDQKGNLDTSFGVNGFADVLDGAPSDLALQPDGKILAGGAFRRDGPGEPFASVARFTSNGTLDPSFADQGRSASKGILKAYAIALDAQGRIIMAGRSESGVIRIARLLPNGAPDASFGVQGMSEPLKGADATVVIAQDGKIVLGIRTGTWAYAARYTEQGRPDTTFHTTGESDYLDEGLTPDMRVAVQPDGKILASLSSNPFMTRIVRLDTAGELDPGFGDKGILKPAPPVSGFKDIVLEPDGRIVGVGLYQPTVYDRKDSGIAVFRLTSAGSPDLGFGEKGLAKSGAVGSPDEYGKSVLVQADGKIVVTGSSIIPAVIRFLPDGRFDPSVSTFSDSYPGITARGLPSSMGTMIDGLVAVAGNRDGSLFLLSSNGKIATLWTEPESDRAMRLDLKGLTATSMVYDESSNQLVICGRTGVTDTSPMGIATVSTLPPFTQVTKGASPSGSGTSPTKLSAYRLALLPEGKAIVAGSVSLSGERSDIALARFDASLALDTSFGKDGTVTHDISPLAIEMIEGVAALPDGGAIAVGYTADARYDRAMAPPLPSQAFAVKIRPDGSLDPGFAIQGVWRSNFGKSAGAAFALAVLPDGKVLIAGQRWEGSLEQGVVVRLLPTGVPDTGFGDNGTYVLEPYAPSAFYALAPEATGAVLATGRGFVPPGGFDLVMVRIRP